MKYTSLQSFEAYQRAQTPPGQSEITADTQNLIAAIERAEEAMDCEYASHLEYRLNVLEMAEIAFVDAAGWLRLQLRHPIIAVSAVQVMDTDAGDTDWQDLTIKQALPGRSPTLYPADPPTLRSYGVRIYSSQPVLGPTPTGGLLVQVTYTSGYSVIPAAVSAVCNAWAAYYYELREMPTGRVVDLEARTVTTATSLPLHLRDQVRGWRRENF